MFLGGKQLAAEYNASQHRRESTKESLGQVKRSAGLNLDSDYYATDEMARSFAAEATALRLRLIQSELVGRQKANTIISDAFGDESDFYDV
jgi:hypothetical protein